MINVKQIFYFLLLSISIIGILGCQSENQTGKQAQNSSKETAASSDDASSLSAVLDQYFVLKDALVETDAASGMGHAHILLSVIETSFSGLDNSELVNQLNSLKAAVQPIASSENIEEQRAAFEKATAGMLDIIKKYKPTDKTLYYQYCPMAFNNKGAYWISNEKKIMNPYFGDKMLHCGKVVEKL